MNTLPVIKQACLDALDEAEHEDPAWRAAYVSIVDPLSVLEMGEIVETLLTQLETYDPASSLVANVRARLGV